MSGGVRERESLRVGFDELEQRDRLMSREQPRVAVRTLETQLGLECHRAFDNYLVDFDGARQRVERTLPHRDR